jgi:GNAT superfamily N-acetyltransferase
VAVLGNRPLGPGDELLQLVFLHVSRDHRRRGVATLLMDASAGAARRRGARGLYISATASESAVGLYTSRGAVLLDEPDPELLAKEPEDIHLAEYFD